MCFPAMYERYIFKVFARLDSCIKIMNILALYILKISGKVFENLEEMPYTSSRKLNASLRPWLNGGLKTFMEDSSAQHMYLISCKTLNLDS